MPGFFGFRGREPEQRSVAPSQAPPLATEVLQEEVRWLRQQVNDEKKISERLREEVLSLTAGAARQQIEEVRALHHQQQLVAEGKVPTTPPPDPGSAPDASTSMHHSHSLVGDGHLPPGLTPEDERLMREEGAREDERIRQAQQRERELDEGA